MAFLQRLNPAGGIADFWHEFRRPNPYRWPILLIASLMTGVLVWLVAREQYYLPPEVPKVTYINTFPEGRTLEEIRASNRENQARKEKLAAEQEAREEEAREAYRALARASGMDVEEIEARIAEEKAAEAAARKARLDRFVAPPADAADPAVAN